MLPKIIKDAVLSADGVGYGGRVDSVPMIKLARKMEEYIAGGMSGPVEVDVAAEKLEIDFEAAELSPALLKLFGQWGVQYRVNGSAEIDDGSCGSDAIEMMMRGRLTEIDPDKHKPGELGKIKYRIAMTYVKVSVNNEVLIEIDNANYIYIVGGKDMLAERRNNLKI